MQVSTDMNFTHELNREALIQGKHIIPLLWPDMGEVEARIPCRHPGGSTQIIRCSSGWQGSHDVQDWWQHPALTRIATTWTREGAPECPGLRIRQEDLASFAPISIQPAPQDGTQCIGPLVEASIVSRILENLHLGAQCSGP